MRVPRNYAIERPEFGVYLTLEGWAIWGLFPARYAPNHPMIGEFSRWCTERGIRMDIARFNRSGDLEYGGIVPDERQALEFKMAWTSPEYA
jgi:hypothetical protein